MTAPRIDEQPANWQSADLPIPPGFTPTARLDVTIDGEPAKLLRYERANGVNRGLLGEHVSTLYNQAGLLKGFMRMDLSHAGRPLPTREEARETALSFLREHAPDLLDRMEISWIEPHNETINLQRDSASEGGGEAVMLTGMKVKCRNTADGRWFWVIVGPAREVMTFERDIVWITMPGHRQTEKWLHDYWLKEHGHQLTQTGARPADRGALMAAVAPKGAAIPGISPAMIVENGRLMFLSGHLPLDGKGRIAGSDLEAQLVRIFENLLATLRAADADQSALLRLTLYVRGYSPDMLPTIRAVRDRFINQARPPASALIGVDALFHPDALAEVDAIAVLPPGEHSRQLGYPRDEGVPVQ